MPKLLDRPRLAEPQPAVDGPPGAPDAPPPGLDTALYGSDRPPARRELRAQIASLEAELADLVRSAFGRVAVDVRVRAEGGPRLLSVDELERVRDALAGRVREARAALEERGRSEQEARRLIEGMLRDPAAHRWVRVSNRDIGEPGCRHWHARPRFGLLGMILGWWRVKLSSGCPLAGGRRPAAPRIPRPE